MNIGKAPACVPTWRGHIETTKDALIIFEACFTGNLNHCFRRPHDRERNQLIVSGNVFVYEEATSGIKRWTDGIPWSPSRILTNFLIYRQLNSPFPPGEKKRATKRSQRFLKPGEPYPAPISRSRNSDETIFPYAPESPGIKADESPDKDGDRGLVGSLVDSYEFKENGLLKKTMTVTINNVQHHLVSYYSLDDAKYHLGTPRDDPLLKDLPLRDELLHQPKFKFPNFDDAGDGAFEQMEASQTPYPYMSTGYDQIRHFPIQGHGHHQEPSSHFYYAGMGPYATSSHAQSTTVSYASIPSTPSTYAPALSTYAPAPSTYAPAPSPYAPAAPATITYPQHQVHQPQQQPTHHQPQRQSQPQTQRQPQQQIKSELQHQIKSELQHHPQYQTHYQPQYHPIQHLAPQDQLQQMNTFQQPLDPHTLPRPSGMLGSMGSSPDNLGWPLGQNDFFTSFNSAVAPLPSNLLSYAQTSQMGAWHMPHSYSTRADGPAFAYQRAQS